MSNTFVYKLTDSQISELRSKLNQGDFEFRKLAHAKFQVRADGLTASMYNSGKLVVQGKNAESWCTQFIGNLNPEESKSGGADKEESTFKKWPPVAGGIGSDEAGKGDSFGGLVVCAVGLNAAVAAEVAETAICDSKQMSDNQILKFAPWLKERVQYHLIDLTPEEYNSQWQSHGANVNKLLTALHGRCIQNVNANGDFDNIVVDKFSAREPVSSYLKKLQIDSVLEAPKAEEYLPVACASVIARAAFLEQMKSLSEQVAVDLPLGSGAPVPPALRRYRQVHGNSSWQQVAKMHFKNIQNFIT
ncbi:MAG: ribonuclease HIII, partial [Planctomycetota bacterium]|nr:ribonuclease HIII [Planctomycetota bacterium]